MSSSNMICRVIVKNSCRGRSLQNQRCLRIGNCNRHCRQLQRQQHRQDSLFTAAGTRRTNVIQQQQKRRMFSSAAGQQQNFFENENNHGLIFLATTGAAMAAMTIATMEKMNERRLENHSATTCSSAALLRNGTGTSISTSCASSSSDNNNRVISAPSSPPSPQPIKKIRAGARKQLTNGPRNVMLHRMRSVKARALNEKYRVDWKTCLGEGAYGSVHPARLASTGEKVALKKITKRFSNSFMFQNETNALLRIYDNGGHPNISGLRDIYEDYEHFYLILDLVSGGEMFDHLINYGAYSESDAARLMHEIASALAFLHGIGVIHSDLKPENLLLCSKNRNDGTIKMIDFGCAETLDDVYVEDDEEKDDGSYDSENNGGNENPPNADINRKDSEEGNGTTAYWAPERFAQKDGMPKIDTPSDLWAVGVILYIMLTGIHPFDTENCATDEEIEKHIQTNPRPPMSEEFVGHLSPSAIDLINKLMEPDPEKRITAYEMLHHPWVRGETALTDKILDSDKKLSTFQDIRSQLEAGVFAVLISQGHGDMTIAHDGGEGGIAPKSTHQKSNREDTSDYPQVEASGTNNDTTSILKRAFEAFDSEGKGFITLDDMSRVVNKQTDAKLSSKDTEEFISSRKRDEGYYDEEDQEHSSQLISLSDFSGILSGLKHKHFPRGHYIFHSGDQGDAMYFLNSGKVEIQTRKGQLVAILRNGDFFGEGSLLDDRNVRFTTAKCTTPVDVIEIKRKDFEKYMASSAVARREIRTKWRARHLLYAKNLLRLQKNVQIRTYSKGETVYKEGDTGTSMYHVDGTDGGELEVFHGSDVVHRYGPGDSFGESSLLFQKPRSSTVTCISQNGCKLTEMEGEDFMNVVNSSPELAMSLRNMCRKRLFKKAIKTYSMHKLHRGFTDDDIIATFQAIAAENGDPNRLTLDGIKHIMHTMDPNYPIEEISALMKFVDIDEDGSVGLDEFKKLFRQFSI